MKSNRVLIVSLIVAFAVGLLCGYIIWGTKEEIRTDLSAQFRTALDKIDSLHEEIQRLKEQLTLTKKNLRALMSIRPEESEVQIAPSGEEAHREMYSRSDGSEREAPVREPSDRREYSTEVQISPVLPQKKSYAYFPTGQLPVLVETEWLADHVADENMRIVYVASPGVKKEHFDTRHIPGSIFFDCLSLMTFLGDGSSPPDTVKFESLMSVLGIKNDTTVVVMGSSVENPCTAALFWLMKYHRHQNVKYLNGGLKKWVKEGRETSGVPFKVKAVKYEAQRDNSIYADAAYTLKKMNNTDVAILDVRSTKEYAGQYNFTRNERAGHIPRAVNIDSQLNNLSEEGTFKTVDELRAIYRTHGISPDKEIIVYGQSGIRSAHTHFVLKYIMGYPNVRNYVGSWAEWGNRLEVYIYPAELQESSLSDRGTHPIF